MAQNVIDQPIPNINESWDGYTGSRVEEFIKNELNGKAPINHVHGVAPQMLNITVASGKTTLENTFNSLKSNESALLVITGASGTLPSSDKYVTAHPDVAGLFGSGPFGASVGDAVIVIKYKMGPIDFPIIKHLPLNDAKAPNGSFPGAMGLESPWDKTQINKIPALETAVNESFKYPTRGESNMNNALESGVYPWCTSGRPSGCSGAFTCFVERTTTADGAGFYTIKQTALGRQNENGRVWTRFIFHRTGETQFGDWKEVLDSNSLANINDLLNSKANTYHMHTTSQISGLDAALKSAMSTNVRFVDFPSGKWLKDNGYYKIADIDNTSLSGYDIAYIKALTRWLHEKYDLSDFPSLMGRAETDTLYSEVGNWDNTLNTIIIQPRASYGNMNDGKKASFNGIMFGTTGFKVFFVDGRDDTCHMGSHISPGFIYISQISFGKNNARIWYDSATDQIKCNKPIVVDTTVSDPEPELPGPGADFVPVIPEAGAEPKPETPNVNTNPEPQLPDVGVDPAPNISGPGAE